MSDSRKIYAPLTLCLSRLLVLLVLSAPVQAVEPDEDLEVTMDVLDDEEDSTGTEMVVREVQEADDDDGDVDDDDRKDSDDRNDAADDDMDKDGEKDEEDEDEQEEDDEEDETDDRNRNDD
jgi:hypothetical protein